MGVYKMSTTHHLQPVAVSAFPTSRAVCQVPLEFFRPLLPVMIIDMPISYHSLTSRLDSKVMEVPFTARLAASAEKFP